MSENEIPRHVFTVRDARRLRDKLKKNIMRITSPEYVKKHVIFSNDKYILSWDLSYENFRKKLRNLIMLYCYVENNITSHLLKHSVTLNINKIKALESYIDVLDLGQNNSGFLNDSKTKTKELTIHGKNFYKTEKKIVRDLIYRLQHSLDQADSLPFDIPERFKDLLDLDEDSLGDELNDTTAFGNLLEETVFISKSSP